MKNLYFKRSNGQEIRLLENCSEPEAVQKINAFLDDHDFKSYYWRTWTINNVTHFDVGSHTEFFLLKEE